MAQQWSWARVQDTNHVWHHLAASGFVHRVNIDYRVGRVAGQWCDMPNVPGKWVAVGTLDGTAWLFTDERAAIMFKLRWC